MVQTTADILGVSHVIKDWNVSCFSVILVYDHVLVPLSTFGTISKYLHPNDIATVFCSLAAGECARFPILAASCCLCVLHVTLDVSTEPETATQQCDVFIVQPVGTPPGLVPVPRTWAWCLSWWQSRSQNIVTPLWQWEEKNVDFEVWHPRFLLRNVAVGYLSGCSGIALQFMLARTVSQPIFAWDLHSTILSDRSPGNSPGDHLFLDSAIIATTLEFSVSSENVSQRQAIFLESTPEEIVQDSLSKPIFLLSVIYHSAWVLFSCEGHKKSCHRSFTNWLQKNRWDTAVHVIVPFIHPSIH